MDSPHDLLFSLHDAEEGGNRVGPLLTNTAVVLKEGMFTVSLDFGPEAYDGGARWLKIAVRPSGEETPFTVLRPRQRLTATPHALFASVVADGSVTREKLGNQAVGTNALATEVATAVTGLSSNYLWGVMGSLLVGSTLYVSPQGDDSTAQRGRPDKAFATLSNAVLVAETGDTIAVYPGRYTNQASRFFEQAARQVHWKTNLTIEGLIPGTAVLYSTNLGNMLSIYECSGIRIRNLTFEGVRWTNVADIPCDTYGHLAVIQSEHVLIENCRFLDGTSFGIIERGNTWCSTNDIVVRDCYFRNFGSWVGNACPDQQRYDGAGIACGGWTVENCEIWDCSTAIEPFPRPPGVVVRNVIIRNNRIYNSLSVAIGTSNPRVHGAVVQDNVIVNYPGYTRGGSNSFRGIGIGFEGGQSVIIQNNRIEGKDTGILVGPYGEPVTNAMILNNVISGTRLESGIILGGSVDGAYDCRIAGNVITRPALNGIAVINGYNCQIVNNTVIDAGINTAAAGIWLAMGTSNLWAMGNVIVDNGSGNYLAAIKAEAWVRAVRLDANRNYGIARLLSADSGAEVVEADWPVFHSNHLQLLPGGGLAWENGLKASQGTVPGAFSVSLSNAPASLVLGEDGSGDGLSLVPCDWNGTNYQTLSIADSSVTRTNLRSLRVQSVHLGIDVILQSDSAGAVSVSSNSAPTSLILGAPGKGDGLALVPEDWNGVRFQALSVRDNSGVPENLQRVKAQSVQLGSGAVILTGSGDPNGVVAAPPGSLFLRTDGGPKSTLYVKTNGFDNLGWGGK